MHAPADRHQQATGNTPLAAPSSGPDHFTITTGPAGREVTTLLTRAGHTALARKVYGPLLSDPAALFVVAAIESRRNRRSSTVRVRQDVLAAMSRRTPRTISTALRNAMAAGVLEAKQQHPRAPYTFHVSTTPDASRPEVRYEEIPNGFFVDVPAGRLRPDMLPVWLMVDRALGENGWTRDTAEELARSLKLAGGREVSTRTIRRHVHKLASAGYLSITEDATGWTLTRPAATPEASQEAVDTADTDFRSPRTRISGPVQTPVVQTPELPAPPLPQDRPVSDAQAAATASLRPKGKTRDRPPRRRRGRELTSAERDPRVARILARLPRDLAAGPAARWRPGLAAATLHAIDVLGLPEPAILRALSDTDLDHHGGREVPALRAAFHALATDIRHHHACPSCASPDGHDGALCPRCSGTIEQLPELEADANEQLELPPLTERLALYRSGPLAMTPEQVAAAGDTEAAHALELEHAGSVRAGVPA